MAKVVQLTSVHVPFDTRIFHKECRSLSEAGHEVILFAPHDKSEVVDGVRVEGVTGRRRFRRMLLTPLELYRRAAAQAADVYHFHDPELLPVGWALARKGHRVIWDSHEDVTRQLLTKEWIPSPARRPAARLAGLVERKCTARFAAVISAEPAGVGRFDHDHVLLLQNWPRLSEFATSTTPYPERERIAAYVGNITRLRGVLEMVEAVNLLPAELGVRLELGGSFAPARLRDEVEERDRFGRIRALGLLPRPQVQALLGRARLGVVVLHPTDQYRTSQPVKLLEYMAAGLPIVASDFPVWRELAGEGTGLYVDPSDPTAIAEAIRWVMEHEDEAAEMGARGRARVVKQFSWEAESKNLLDLYDQVLDAPRSLSSRGAEERGGR